MNGSVVVNNIKLPIDASHKEAFSVAARRIKSLGLIPSDYEYKIYRRSIDARNKNNIIFVYSVSVSGSFPEIDKSRLLSRDMAFSAKLAKLSPTIGNKPLSAPPVVVGAGPCGLFCALLLAEHGYRPVLIERGGSVKERQIAVSDFNKNRIFSEETNIQFGAGGAGTFSDGKLVTRVNDPLTDYVLSRFVEFGASDSIRFIAKPHVGTDVLSEIVEKIIRRISSLGGTVLYHTQFICANTVLGKVVSIKTTNGEIPCGALVLATGHSARDTYLSLIDNGFSVEAKNFSVGMRIEHLASDIDRAMYGDSAGNPRLGHAEYNLSNDTKSRGVYTFCMCPGGEVVAAASEKFGVVVNGMSYNNRAGINSNSAVVTTVFKKDFGANPLDAIKFQRNIEQRAYVAGGSDYRAPIITVGDFLSGKCSNEPTKVLPTYMNGDNLRICRPESYLPLFVCEGISRALVAFDKKIKGFADSTALLTGAETRTSAPVRILRDPVSGLAMGTYNIYPAGEGAGYAGGITSAAIDGLKTAILIINEYKP